MANEYSRVGLRSLNSALGDVNRSNQRLASGKRINSAADDPAGLAIADKLLSDAATFKQASNNAGYAQSLLAIQDGALEQVSQIGGRLRELSAQAANGTLSDEQRGALNEEYQALTAEAERIAGSTEFNGNKVFSGESSTFQVGISSDSTSQITVGGTDLSALLAGIKAGDISTQAGAQAALETSGGFINDVSAKRGVIGAANSRLETATKNIEIAAENLRSAESRIRDIDVAEESARRISADIRANAAQSVIAQGKLSAQSVLKLLK